MNNEVNNNENLNQPVEQTTPIENTNLNPSIEQTNTIDNATINERLNQPVDTMSNLENTTAVLPTVTNDVPQVETYEMPKKKGMPVFVIILILLVLICGVGYFVFTNILNNPKTIIQNEFDVFSKGIISSVEEIDKNSIKYDLDKESIGIKGTFQMSSDYKSEELDLTQLGNIKYNYEGAIDKKNNKAYVSFNVDENSSKLLDVTAGFINNDMLINLNDIYSKVIKVKLDKEVKDLNFDNSLNKESIIKLVEKTNTILKNNVDSKDIKKQSVSRTINGKKGTYTQISYNIDVKKLSENLLKEYENDEEIIKILSDLIGENEKKVKGNIDEYLEELQNTEIDEQLVLNNYFKGFNNALVETEILYKEKNYKDEYDTTSIIIDKEKNTYTYKLLGNDKEVLKGTYDPNSKKYTMTMEDETIKVELTMTVDNETVKGNLTAKEEGFKADIDFTINTKTTSDKQTQDTTIDIKFEANEEKVNIKLNNNMELSKNVEVSEVDQSNVIDSESITEEEYTTLYNNLMEKISTIMNKIVPEETANTFLREIM